MTDGSDFEPIHWSRRFALRLLGYAAFMGGMGPVILIVDGDWRGWAALIGGASLGASALASVVRSAPALAVRDGWLVYTRMTSRRRPVAGLTSVTRLSKWDTWTSGGRVRLEFADHRGYSVPLRWLEGDPDEIVRRLQRLRTDRSSEDSET